MYATNFGRHWFRRVDHLPQTGRNASDVVVLTVRLFMLGYPMTSGLTLLIERPAHIGSLGTHQAQYAGNEDKVTFTDRIVHEP